MQKISILLLLLYIKLSFSSNCIENENGCLKCNNKTYLCDQCLNDILIPDNEGGCIGIKKCIQGKNYCMKCDEFDEKCEFCENGYFPDNNGGCSYTSNCELSYKGECFKCNKDYFLMGRKKDDIISDFKICKSYFSSDLKDCEIINEQKGICTSCKEGYFLDDKDFKCTKTINCAVSVYGICTQCIYGYHLDKKNNTCLLSKKQFLFCKETIDEEFCESCIDNYFLSENDKRCVLQNYCSKTKDLACSECIEGYYLSENSGCSYTEHCKNADYETGFCEECIEGFYLDLKDRKCKSNSNDEDFKFCKEVNNYCISCFKRYYLGEDKRCSSTKNCSESENGICSLCSSNYYLSKNNRCTKVKNCLIANEFFECIECEDNFYYNKNLNKCIKITNSNFINCKVSDPLGNKCAYCKDDYYLNYTDNLCYNNTEYGMLYKCALASENGEYCKECIKNYDLGTKDNKCVNTALCKYSDEHHKCLECEKGYYLNLSNSFCYYNYAIEEEKEKKFYKCSKTNEEGTACHSCETPFVIGEKGLCINYDDCEIKDGDNCIKCNEGEKWFHYCLNKDFGCVETSNEGCLICNNIFDLESCDKCLEGYKLDKYTSPCYLN